MDKYATSFRLSPEAKALLDKLAAAKGINRTAVIETLIREAAKKEGVRSGQ